MDEQILGQKQDRNEIPTTVHSLHTSSSRVGKYPKKQNFLLCVYARIFLLTWRDTVNGACVYVMHARSRERENIGETVSARSSEPVPRQPELAPPGHSKRANERRASHINPGEQGRSRT